MIEINAKAKPKDEYLALKTLDEVKAAIEAGKYIATFKKESDSFYDHLYPSKERSDELLLEYLSKFNLKAHKTWRVVVYRPVCYFYPATQKSYFYIRTAKSAREITKFIEKLGDNLQEPKISANSWIVVKDPGASVAYN